MSAVIGVRLVQLRSESRRKGVPDDVASSASEAVRRWAEAQGVVSGRRLRDYYWATIRRLVFTHAGGARELRRRYVVASMVQDLRSAGFDESRIREEVVRYYGTDAACVCCAA